jgi:putative toxin-antitoxin system antitoxin component (TIGR02293 family)
LSRRPIEKYEAKINSGNIVLIAEVVRDLYDSDTQPERSIYEAALDRLSHEMAAAQRITVSEAIRDIGIMIRGKLTAHETAPTGLRATASGSKLTEPKRLATEGYIDRIWSEVFPIAPALRANPEALAALAHRGYSDDEISLLVLPKNILARRISTGELLTVEETDKALRLERVARLAERIFGSPDKAYRWLRKPKRELHGETPLAFLASEVGARLVEEMLGRIEHGIFA